MGHNSKVFFYDTTGFTVASGGQLNIESGGAFNIESGGGLDIESGGDIDVESGGHIDIESGGYLAYPVAGATSGAALGTSDAAAIAKNGFVFMVGAATTQHLDLATPSAGTVVEFYVTPLTTGGAKVFDAGSGITFDSTNRYMWLSSTNSDAATNIGHLRLVGHSTTYWVILERTPTTCWEAGATTA